MMRADFVTTMRVDTFENSLYYDHLLRERRRDSAGMRQWQLDDIASIGSQIDWLRSTDPAYDYHIQPEIPQLPVDASRQLRIVRDVLADPDRAARCVRTRRYIVRIMHGWLTGFEAGSYAELARYLTLMRHGEFGVERARAAYRIALADLGLAVDFGRAGQETLDIEMAGAARLGDAT